MNITKECLYQNRILLWALLTLQLFNSDSSCQMTKSRSINQRFIMRITLHWMTDSLKLKHTSSSIWLMNERRHCLQLCFYMNKWNDEWSLHYKNYWMKRKKTLKCLKSLITLRKKCKKSLTMHMRNRLLSDLFSIFSKRLLLLNTSWDFKNNHNWLNEMMMCLWWCIDENLKTT